MKKWLKLIPLPIFGLIFSLSGFFIGYQASKLPIPLDIVAISMSVGCLIGMGIIMAVNAIIN